VLKVISTRNSRRNVFILFASTTASIMDGPALAKANVAPHTSDVFEVNPPETDEDESADVPVLRQQENEKADDEANSDTEATETVGENSETKVEAIETDDDTDKPARKNDDEEVEEESEAEDEEESEAEDEDHVVDPDAPEDDDVAPNAAAKKSEAFCLFTTGLGFSSGNKTRLRTVVESAAKKKKFSRTWHPDSSMCGLVCRWARKPSYDFAADIMNSNYVVARELGLGSPFDLCNLRGWILTRRAGSKGDFRVECKRFHECLKHANFPPEHSALNLNAIIQSMCNRLETSCLPSDPTDPTPPPIAASHHKKSKKVV
jgi:hypothetical protein